MPNQDPVAWSMIQALHFSKVRPNISEGVDWSLFSEHLPHPMRVLDVGCNGGHVVEQLRQRGVEAYGIDLPEVIEKAKARVKQAGRDMDEPGRGIDMAAWFQPCNLEIDDIPSPLGDPAPFAEGQPWRPMPYDLVLMLGVFEHIVNFEGLLPKAAAVMAPRATLVLTTCNRRSIEIEPFHYRHYTVEELVAYGLQAGMETFTVSRLGVNDTGLKVVYRRLE